MKHKFFAIMIMLSILLIALVPAGIAAPSLNEGVDDPQPVPKEDNRADPLTIQQAALKEEAVEARLNGKAYGKTHEVARGQYVELEREGEGAIWTVLGEFADLAHNTMPEPDRTVDNTTIWVPDFNRD
jgi:immune inhibitor A